MCSGLKCRVTKNAVNLFDTIDEKKSYESYISSDIYALSFKLNNETIQYRNQKAQESPPLSKYLAITSIKSALWYQNKISEQFSRVDLVYRYFQIFLHISLC